MTLPPARHPWTVVALLSLGLAWTVVSGDLLRPWLRAHLPASMLETPYLASALISAADLVVLALLVALALRITPWRVLAGAGLTAPIARPLAWSLVWLVPGLVAASLLATPVETVTAADVAWLALGGPISEEIVYRGIAVGVLVRACGWHWLPACLWPALFFGVVHAGQGQDLGSTLGIVAVTGAGGLLFGWLFVRWDFNLWPPILLHVGLNGLWLVFGLGDDAIGGLVGNGLRLTIVLVAILATIRLAPGANADRRLNPV
jgi:membrane protease YdiL (CAAX protease family)